MRIVTGIAIIAVAVGVLAASIRLGAYNVAATEPHSALTNTVLHAAMRYSVRARAQHISPPPLDDPALVKNGFSEYHEMCQVCHGGPGIKPDEAGQGLMPRAPDLTRTAGHWSDAELFWIVKNGIRMTGMPAWGPTHEDRELWTIVAFVRRLPSLSPQDYQKWIESDKGNMHHHGDDAH